MLFNVNIWVKTFALQSCRKIKYWKGEYCLLTVEYPARKGAINLNMFESLSSSVSPYLFLVFSFWFFTALPDVEVHF
jgi:hypothetical protein